MSHGTDREEVHLTPVLPEGQVGVLIGRFQVPYLTEAHHNLLKTVMARHKRVLVVMGTKAQPTSKDPLDFETRMKMLYESYPGIMMLPLPDTKYDDLWVTNLETLIRGIFPSQTCVLYGGRDSFVSIYRGVYKGKAPKFQTVEFEEFGEHISGTKLRKEAACNVLAVEAFRTGIIYGAANQFPPLHMCVDLAPLNKEGFLLGKRDEEPKFRFIGGHVEKKHRSLEGACKAEGGEEAGANIETLVYVGSSIIDDWRYRGTSEGILTALFEGPHLFGPVQAGDDIDQVRWFTWREASLDLVEPEHVVLMEMFMAKHNNEISMAKAEWDKLHPPLESEVDGNAP